MITLETRLEEYTKQYTEMVINVNRLEAAIAATNQAIADRDAPPEPIQGELLEKE
jgi:hypothetical protein